MNFRQAAFGFAVLLLPFTAQAQSQFPGQPIKLIVPYAAGGLPDTTARIVAQHLPEKAGQSAVVENRPGGAGSVAVNALTSAPAILDKLAAAVIAMVKMPETQKQMGGAGIEPAGENGAAFGKYLAAEAAYVAKVIETAGIKVE